jgi:hypothetical protein
MRQWCRLGAVVGWWMLLCASPVWAGDTVEPVINSGDVAWLLAASALVVGMIVPGLAFY